MGSPLTGIYGSRQDELEIMAMSAQIMAENKEDSGAGQKNKGSGQPCQTAHTQRSIVSDRHYHLLQISVVLKRALVIIAYRGLWIFSHLQAFLK